MLNRPVYRILVGIIVLNLIAISTEAYEMQPSSEVHQKITQEATEVWDDIPSEIETHLTNSTNSPLDSNGYDLGDEQ